ncbi:hypothetical protein FA13DRAFT_1796930 [Coprinellus micaceus]|uniref:RING-type domain-containing protein n=1 Tax=Coprinellus micaceus TaxID=71717 RepID=A0A4Y7SS88_COPMI|nr:hypothetical protein FA13DRAFT_1796930 [Coprinellus micaceus]
MASRNDSISSLSEYQRAGPSSRTTQRSGATFRVPRCSSGLLAALLSRADTVGTRNPLEGNALGSPQAQLRFGIEPEGRGASDMGLQVGKSVKVETGTSSAHARAVNQTQNLNSRRNPDNIIQRNNATFGAPRITSGLLAALLSRADEVGTKNSLERSALTPQVKAHFGIEPEGKGASDLGLRYLIHQVSKPVKIEPGTSNAHARVANQTQNLNNGQIPGTVCRAFNAGEWAYDATKLTAEQLGAIAIVVEEDRKALPDGTRIAFDLDEDGDAIMGEEVIPPTLRPDHWGKPEQVVTETVATQRVLELFPHIDRGHLDALVKKHAATNSGPHIVELIVVEILDCQDGQANAKQTEMENHNGGDTNVVRVYGQEREIGVEKEKKDRKATEKPNSNVDDHHLTSYRAEHHGEKAETHTHCQCCFEGYPSKSMAECPAGHPFCPECLDGYASNRLGVQEFKLKCMHTSGCDAMFEMKALRLFLSPNLLALVEQLQQREDLRNAHLKGLEECPFCDWACVMEITLEESSVFACGNHGKCGIASSADKQTDQRVVIEEAMSRAVIRTCPKCDKAFIKEEGCNKMKCPSCGTLSCYICKTEIYGYDHFRNGPTKCPLWDNVEERHNNELDAAYRRTIAGPRA